MREADRRDERRETGDPALWAALDGLRDSEVVIEARRYAASRADRCWSPLKAWSAAGVAAAAALALVFAVPRGESLETGVGEIRRATLADGTVVMLNTDSRLRVRFSDGAREVTLVSGQARFDVARDAARPFRVTAGGMTVTAVGTAFDVIAVGRRTAVTLIEGKVLVEESEEVGESCPARAVLAPGQQVALSAGALTRPRPARLDAALAWQRQLVDLSSMTLDQALAEVNRYSEVKVAVADPALGQEQVSGVFKAGDVEAVAAALRAYFGLEVVRRDEERIVLGRPAS